jgi:hypothetical protein
MADPTVRAGSTASLELPANQEGTPWPGEDALTDEELTELALAADPFAPLPADAVPLDLQGGGWALLPSWYMAPVRRHGSTRRYRLAVAAIVAAFLTIDLFGLCSTYGPLVLA